MKPLTPKEFRPLVLRDCIPLPDQISCTTPEQAAAYWWLNVETNPYYNPSVETLIVLCLNTRRRIIGHHVVATGTHDTILAHPIGVFQVPILASAPAIILMHNHPSGDPTPSEGDIKTTRDLIRAGQILKIEVLDHVIVTPAPGAPNNPETPEAIRRAYSSLRELGYFYS